MKNLKRVLSLGLASVMLMGMMVMGASAANKDFTDAEDIVHDEAVDVMVSLKIINGKEDGSYFAPKDTVTRGEMAKMIAVMMNGGSEANTGVKTNPTFTDIGGHWAEGWIEYCADMKIINGRGDGTFDPNGNVTGVEALKMVLTAMGYDADAYHLKGAAWASQTLERARQCNPVKLTEDLDDVTMTQPATRDVAAQMIWNGLQAYVVINSPSQNTNSGEVTWDWGETSTTLLKQRYDANVATGDYVGNHNYNGNGALKGEINVNLKRGDSVTSTTVKNPDGTYTTTSGAYSAKFPSDMSIDNIGEEVKVVWKDSNKGIKGPDKEDTIYGVFNTGATRVIRSNLSKIGNQKSSKEQINIDGTLYDVVEDSRDSSNVATAGNVTIVVNYAHNITNKLASNGLTVEEAKNRNDGSEECNSALTNQLKRDSGAPFKAIFNDDGKISTIYVVESYLAAVTGTNATNINVDNGVGNLKFDDHDIEEGLERGDVVVVTPLYDTTYGGSKMVVTVKKAEKVSGELTAYKSNKDSQAKDPTTGNLIATPEDENLTIDGDTYKVYNKNVGGKKLNTVGSTAALRTSDIPEEDGDIISKFYEVKRENDFIGEDFDLYLVDGFVAAAVQTSESTKNYSVITEVKTAIAGGTFDVLQLQVMGADGTKEVITVSDDSKVWDKNANNGAGKVLSHDAARTNNKNIDADDYHVGDIVTYSFNDDDEAEVTIRGLVTDAAVSNNITNLTYDEKAKTVNYKLNGVSKSVPTTGDALFFTNTEAGINYDSPKMSGASWEAYNLRALDEIKESYYEAGHISVALNSDGDRVVAVFVNMMNTPDGAGDDDVYGIISGYNGRVKDYYVYTVQANGEEYTVNYKGDTSDDLTKGTLVKFNPTADDNYKKGKVVNVKTYDGTAPNANLKWHHGWASELKDDVLVFFEGTNAVTQNGDKVYVKNSESKSYALDKDCKIVYVDQDGDKSLAEGSVTEFSSITGTENVGFVVKKTTNENGSDRYVIVALFVETSNKVNI